MPTKGNVRRITSKALYHKKIRLYRGKIRESEKAEVRPSGSAGDSASLSLSVQPDDFVTACAWLRRASARRTCLCQAHAVVTKYKLMIKLFGICKDFFAF